MEMFLGTSGFALFLVGACRKDRAEVMDSLVLKHRPNNRSRALPNFPPRNLTPLRVAVPVLARRCHGYIAAPDGFSGVQLQTCDGRRNFSSAVWLWSLSINLVLNNNRWCSG